MTDSTRVVVVGAGIAGVSTAYSLAVARGVADVVVVDPRPPLSLTSDKSTECYRNWWPSAPMVGLMNRSIDLLESMAAGSGNVFSLGRRGYLFSSADERRFDQMVSAAHQTSALGGGPVRVHPGPDHYQEPGPGYTGQPEGADVFRGPGEVLARFPYLTPRVVGAIHVRRAGWLSAQQLGSWMLDEARSAGATLVADEVTAISTGTGGHTVHLRSGDSLRAPIVIDAAGPMSKDVAAMVGLEVPLFTELHLKVTYKEHLGVIPRDAPMVIWSDPQHIPWSEEERSALVSEGRRDLLGEMPVFCHGRPEGGAESPYLLALWEYHGMVTEPEWPLPDDPLYPEVVMRGLSTMIPGLAAYLDRLPASTVDGGYYTKTAENRPLIGPAGPDGFHLVSGLSGFGIMAAAGAADLVARHVTGEALPDYAPAFLLDRYRDPRYLESISGTGGDGQL